MSVHRPAVIGAGTMGMGIAEFLAAAGHQVQVYEISAQIFERALDSLRKRLRKQVEKGRFTTGFADALISRIHPVYELQKLHKADVIIEAAVERLEVKKEIFSQLDAVTSPKAVLASNTSSLSITSIASALQHPERVLGLHFFNPAQRMPLVEVVLGAETDPGLAQAMMDWMMHLGKIPVKVADSPGFLVNRVARPFHLEAYWMVSEGVASKEQVDRIMRSAGFKMGPFELQDLIGIDINYAASVSVYEGFFHEPRFRPHPRQQTMVERGALGRKVGKGHYNYGK
ncbi:3-hydroxyacyl-CoA dehydrogenase NAD-binding domain-containing protein [Paenactinomyces guangxiensis]|uniref:NAD-binding protein n=1 Tax=Paenactinomyces guangxiensis TaxID=1490290 RepID=A0A7W1WP78_9BACL|nr:3-hydroxyacyl-CoA dehydrogenase NAD-binding domain-containing protein [Paenactinomyces guangxiensis]MBA4493408.1 NAD-binding protein [Paenactinomyces guangxiensis]MBH8590499.1 NAD-binding protein [Paenactinomyces guangxiensis]